MKNWWKFWKTKTKILTRSSSHNYSRVRVWCVCNFSFVVGPFGPTTTEIRFFTSGLVVEVMSSTQHKLTLRKTTVKHRNTEKSSFFSSLNLVNEFFRTTWTFEDWKMSTKPIDHHHTKWSSTKSLYMNWANSAFLSLSLSLFDACMLI